MWAKEKALLSRGFKILLPTELEDKEEILIATAFSFSLDFSMGAFGAFERIDYCILKDFCKKHQIDSIETLAICKEMLSIRAEL